MPVVLTDVSPGVKILSPAGRSPPGDATTTPSGFDPSLEEAQRLFGSREATALSIAWSAAEPHRVGEVAVLDDDEPARLLGRGAARADDPCPRVAFVRQRPWGTEGRPPIEAGGISRQQLLLTPQPGGALSFERLGRATILCNGRAAPAGTVRPGDTLAIENQLLLFCTRRPSPFVGPRHLRKEQAGPFGEADADGIVGESVAAWGLREEIAFAASSAAHVLILGDSGAGKELVAHAVHRWSARGERPILARSAVSFPDTLIDAELFGNARGYPNPGMALREGLFGAADGTSLFLDEIGELSSALQAHLLRVLDAGGQYHRLGESAARRSSFRLIAATNRPLSALKEDFAARFALRLRIPSLTERREDIPLLCNHLLAQVSAKSPELCERFAGTGPGGARYYRFDPLFIEALLRHAYTLHVRELAKILWASLGESRGAYLQRPRDLPAEPPRAASDAGGAAASSRAEPTAEAIQAALARHRGNRSKAYRDLGLSSRYALGRLLRKLGAPDDDGDAP